MNLSEKDTYQKRLEILNKLIQKEFPSEKIDSKHGEIISISRTSSITEKERRSRIDFNPDYDFMTDSDSNYEEVFNNGIQIAKQKLEDPPFRHRNFQGEILLTHEGASFFEKNMEMNNEQICVRDSYNEVIDILRNFIWQLMHHRALREVIVEFERDFWRLAFNNSYDLSIIEWCKIFGSYSENTHWTRIFYDATEFRKFIYKSVGMNEEQWDAYHHDLTNYRNKWIGHFNSSFKPDHHPNLEPAFKSMLACYNYLLEKMAEYEIQHNLPDSLEPFSKALKNQAILFVKCAYDSTKHIKYKYSSDNITFG